MASRTRGKEAARERAAAMRAAQQRSERRRRALLGVGAVGVVLLIVVALVVAKAAGIGSGGGTTTTGNGTAALPGAVTKGVTTVPAATFDKVGAGTAQNPPKSIDAPALTTDGKPQVLYVGAEYCPFCASQRWPVVVALSRFGTWSGLTGTTSASDDTFPNTPTLSFHGATYTSDYLSFTGVETQTNKRTKDGSAYTPLDKLSKADQKTFESYNKPPYVESSGGIPFLDMGGKFVLTGATYSPEMLAGKSRTAIAQAINDPTSDLGKAVAGSANVLTAALCTLTDQQPADVCTSAGVKAAAGQLSS